MASPNTPVVFSTPTNQVPFGINPIKRKKIHTMILGELVNFIRSQNLQSGDQFPPERKLAEMMGVSRTVIREACSILQWLGVVESRQGSGIRFKKLPDGDLISPTNILLFSEHEELLELFEVRILLEKEGVALAAKRRTQEDLAQMKIWLEESKVQVKSGHFGTEGLFQFHRGMILASHNKLLVKIYDAISSALREAMEFSHGYTVTVEGEPARVIHEHGSILSYIRNGNSEKARRGIMEHLEHSRERILKRISRQEKDLASFRGRRRGNGNDRQEFFRRVI